MDSELYTMTKDNLVDALQITPQIVLDYLPTKPEKLLGYIKRLKTPNISPNIPANIKQMMLENLLSDKEYISTFFSILATSFNGKKTINNPRAYLVVAQTGSGKSNLSAKILDSNSNIIVIDSDKYKNFRPDAEILAKKSPTLYGFLTGPDAYGHRDNVYDFATNNGYNILIEIAPSLKNGLFNVDIDDLIQKGYSIEMDILSVSKLNSALSVHERYEGQIEAELSTPKLTDLNRHNESFDALRKSVKSFQNDRRMGINIYKRATDYLNFPELIFSKEWNNKFTCAFQALDKTQCSDSKRTILEFDERFNALLKQMKRRHAPEEQYMQLESIREMRDMSIEGE